jgi:hypothetical protein
MALLVLKWRYPIKGDERTGVLLGLVLMEAHCQLVRNGEEGMVESIRGGYPLLGVASQHTLDEVDSLRGCAVEVKYREVELALPIKPIHLLQCRSLE